MDKKVNAFWVLFTALIDIALIYCWYIVLYPMKVMVHTEAVYGRAMLMLFTAVVLGLNYMIYKTAIAED